MFCLRSRSTACSVAVSWAICSCLAARSFGSAASCSTLRRIKGEIVRDGFKLLPQLKRGSSRG